MPSRILVVHGDPSMRQNFEQILSRAGFHVLGSATGREGIETATKEQPDLMIVDQDLPDIQGHVICEMIRSAPRARRIPLLVLSGDYPAGFFARCLDSGADGCLIKPVSTDDLVAHVKAILRRPPIYLSEYDAIRKGRMTLRPGERRVFFNKREVAGLTPKEYEVLKELLLRSPRVVGKQALAMKVWGVSFEALHRQTVDVHIQRLRLKLGPVASTFLKTVTLSGYQWLETSQSPR